MHLEQRLVLAVDCGSTNLKVAIFTGALQRLAEGTVPVRYSLDEAPRVEFEVEPFWASFVELVSAVCCDSGMSFSAVTDVSLGSQAQTFSVFGLNGRARTPFYSWLDSRAVSEADDIGSVLGGSFHCHCSFAPAVSQLQSSKMLWLRRHVADVFQADTRIVPLPSLLAWRLGVGNVTDRNLAAMSGVYSAHCGDWWEDALGMCGLSKEQMPCLVDVGEKLTTGRTATWGDLQPAADMRVTFAGNDQTVGAYGNGCDQGGMVVTLGTALVVYRFAGSEAGPYSPGGCWGPYPGGGYYELGTIDEGCYALDWARSKVLPGESAAAFDALAIGVRDFRKEQHAPLFRPRKIRTGNPWTVGAQPDFMAYSTLEGISFALRQLIEVNLHAAGQAERVRVTGGGSKSRPWRQLIADVLQCPVSQAHGDALLGAAAMALGVPCSTEGPGDACAMPDTSRASMLEERYQRWLSLQ